MSNPIFNAFNNPVQNGPISNFSNMLQRFNQFASTFQGDPQQKVQELLDSGQMTKEQLEQLTPLARQLQGLINHR